MGTGEETPWFRELYDRLLGYTGYDCYRDVLSAWLPQARAATSALSGLGELVLPDRDDEDFRIYTYWEGDPREWVVEDNLPAEVSDAMRIAMIFLALHFSTPKI